jgi:hypothetical protein
MAIVINTFLKILSSLSVTRPSEESFSTLYYVETYSSSTMTDD